MRSDCVSVTAIVTAFRRVDHALFTLKRIQDCSPHPNEIIVHVDGYEHNFSDLIHNLFPNIKVILSRENIGPGGGRNKLIKHASNEFVASFDDDSYPLDPDYFFRIIKLFGLYPDVSILDAHVFLPGEEIKPDVRREQFCASFSGGACCYRRSAFLATTGYVPLPVAYGMEEVDLALRIYAQGGKILHTDWLRVYHDTDLAHHDDPLITAYSIANIALLAYLRYPPLFWWVGFLQITKRILWLVRKGRTKGMLTGLVLIPKHLEKFSCYRETLSWSAIKSSLLLRRKPIDVAEL